MILPYLANLSSFNTLSDFFFPIQLSRSPVATLVHWRAASLVWCWSPRIIYFNPKVTGSLVMRLNPKPGPSTSVGFGQGTFWFWEWPAIPLCYSRLNPIPHYYNTTSNNGETLCNICFITYILQCCQIKAVNLWYKKYFV